MSMNATKKIAVFDLNKTVYHKSSKEEFFKFVCYRRNYKLLSLLEIGFYKLIGKLRLLNQTQFKENFFNYLDGLPPEKVAEYASEFWQIEYPKHFNTELLERISQLRKENVTIVFLTGGIYVYVAPLFEQIALTDVWMATEVCYENGTYKIVGKALKDKEKTRRLKSYFADQPFRVVEAYSDEDEDVLYLADKAFLLDDGKIIPLEEKIDR